MNKRILLNVMIVGLLTFYMIFNVVYRQLVDKHEPQQEADIDIWQRPYLVPENWLLIRIEMPSITLQSDNHGGWAATGKGINQVRASEIARSWQHLESPKIVHYQQLPLEGNTILAFVMEDSQPIVFRIMEHKDELHFYRMIDKRMFTFPISYKAQLLPEE